MIKNILSYKVISKIYLLNYFPARRQPMLRGPINGFHNGYSEFRSLLFLIIDRRGNTDWSVREL